ncbi:type II toxin-antitoxin system RelE/ParE family toxin [Peristeroidobacter soli]|uniref:type II toxin-antitoxin system RelE/ParE family toxin n=1 Tax=Peristeroidobacter soli TaxID=2497877 RepID=UPI00101C7590|nr:type II toxin-antitoxin system RelE/ParE family toxin [Peristeroidobacter soli]
MSIYKVRWFTRWARKQGLSDAALCEAVKEMGKGSYEADLGGNLLKKRIARPGQGKRGGFRTIVATNCAGRWFFVYGFAKNERSNIDCEEEAALKRLAKTLLTMASAALSKAKLAGEVTEVDCDA